MSPKLSIVLTSKNRGLLLSGAIQSVLHQSFRDWELIIVDDDSTDQKTLEVLDGFQRLCQSGSLQAHVKFILQDNPGNNAGVSVGGSVVVEEKNACCGLQNGVADPPISLFKRVAIRINQALEIAEGDWISYLCDDDIYYPERCQKYLEHCTDDVDVIVGNAIFVSASGDRQHQNRFRYTYPKGLGDAHDRLVATISTFNTRCNFICHDSVVYRNTALRWPTDWTSVPNDWRFWLQLFEHGYRFKKIGFVGEEATFPGAWKDGLTQEQVLAHRQIRRVDMRKGMYAINTSGKRQNVSATNGISKIVDLNERIDADLVSYCDSSGAKVLYPGFSIDGEFEFTEIKIDPTKNISPIIIQQKRIVEPDEDVNEPQQVEVLEEIPEPTNPTEFKPIAELIESPLTQQNAEPKHPFDV